jgi:ABC-type transport system involved in multi-copper enzyme maturation permease subunit
MKKIISGMFFRLFKGMEFWVLIVLLLVSSFFVGYSRFKDQDFFSLERTETNIARRFESSDVSAFDAYRLDCEAMPADIYYKLSDDVSDAGGEVAFLFDLMASAQVMPVLLIMLFIPVFFGRLFSDGAIKNLMASGHSKGKIYLSALTVTYILDALMFIVSSLVMGFWCLYFGWNPPMYLPVVIPTFIVEMLLVMTLSAVSIAILFVSKKKTLAFIVGFILLLSLRVSVTSVIFSAMSLSQNINVYGDEYEFFKKVREEEPYEIEQRFNFSEAKVDVYYKGQDISFIEDSVLPPVVKNICLAIAYADPALLRNLLGVIGPTQYMLVRDGIVGLNGAANIFWIAVSTFCGIIVFKKKEIRC